MRITRFLAGGALLLFSVFTSQGQDFLVWDLDLNHNSGPDIRNALQGAGYTGVYTDTIPDLGSLPNYGAIFICLGVFPDAVWLGEPAYYEAVDSLVSYLTNNDFTNIYMEGGDTWAYDPATPLHPYFNIVGLHDGISAGTIVGHTGTFTEGMSFSYGGDNNLLDTLGTINSAWVIFSSQGPSFDNGIAYDNGGTSYRTIGTSFELGGLIDGVPPSTRTVLADSIMHFFRIQPTQYQWDVAVVSIGVPDSYILPNVLINPEVTVKNLGQNTATFDVTCEIDSSNGQNIYTDVQPVTNLLPQLTQQVSFADWVPDGVGNTYDVTVYTQLAGDQSPSNDTLSKQTTAFDMTWVIHSPYLSLVPTMDGAINPGEWDDAVCRDVTDVLGMGGGPFPPGQAYLYVKNDSFNVYLAMDAVMDPGPTNLDAFTQFFEDNHDSSWPAWPDSSEGDLVFIWRDGAAGLGFTPRFSDSSSSAPYQAPFGSGAGGSSGNMQYEYELPLGTVPERLAASPGDTVGFGLLVSDEGAQVVFGWWPTNSFDPGRPTNMGDLILGTPFSYHDVGVASIDDPPATVYCDSTYTPRATVENFGNAVETFGVVCAISDVAYDADTLPVGPLNPGEPSQVSFAPWMVPSVPDTYLVRVTTLLPGDVDPTNDTRQLSVVAIMVGVAEGAERAELPEVFALRQSRPNPTKGEVEILYQLPCASRVSLKVYNVAGQVVAVLVDDPQGPGHYSLLWDSKNDSGREVAPGIYFYRLSALPSPMGEAKPQGYSSTGKLVLLR